MKKIPAGTFTNDFTRTEGFFGEDKPRLTSSAPLVITLADDDDPFLFRRNVTKPSLVSNGTVATTALSNREIPTEPSLQATSSLASSLPAHATVNMLEVVGSTVSNER